MRTGAAPWRAAALPAVPPAVHASPSTAVRAGSAVVLCLVRFPGVAAFLPRSGSLSSDPSVSPCPLASFALFPALLLLVLGNHRRYVLWYAMRGKLSNVSQRSQCHCNCHFRQDPAPAPRKH
eukprot:6082690-Lingulodinium_polyedra.AAC.1